mmetsp:Transcript_14939/g.48465  ORF Transcript_14939/g.48465 Transcript_14939/m.48465 type:complete len:651 (-) Transcript_14939:268-2220(-)
MAAAGDTWRRAAEREAVQPGSAALVADAALKVREQGLEQWRDFRYRAAVYAATISRVQAATEQRVPVPPSMMPQVRAQMQELRTLDPLLSSGFHVPAFAPSPPPLPPGVPTPKAPSGAPLGPAGGGFVMSLGSCTTATLCAGSASRDGCAHGGERYDWALCPFQAAWQSPPGLMEGLKSPPPGSTMLGYWAGWREGQLPTLASPGVSLRQPRALWRFEKGEPCWDGPPRSLWVELACGPVPAIEAVEEDGKCSYVMRYASPAACALDPTNESVAALVAAEAAELSPEADASVAADVLKMFERPPGGGGGGDGGAPQQSRRGEGEAADAVLVFLPGFKEIQAVHEALLATPRFSAEPHRAWLLPLHSTLPPEDQRRVFERPPAGVRKVVLATNIAETSVTIDDVVFVVDCARMKEKRYDPARRMESLDDVLVSRANAKQRRGRAGRVRPGVAFHLNTSHSFDHVAEAHQQPEIRRVPLERLVLTIKALKYERCAAAVCEQLLEPPSRPAVLQALRMLVELDALELDGSTLGAGERLTPLGQHLATLPTDVRIGKFLLLGAIFGVADEALTIAAILSGRSPFLSPFDKREAADAAKRGFAVGQSDHLTILNAYNHFDGRSGGERFAFAREHFLSIRSLQTIAQLKRQLLEGI